MRNEGTPGALRRTLNTPVAGLPAHRIATVCIAAGLLAAAVSLVLPKSYRAETRILPAASGGMAGLSDLAAVSGMNSAFAAQFGSQENPVLTYPEILMGGVVLERTLHRAYPPSQESRRVIDALRVEGANERERMYLGVKDLRDRASISANPRTNIIAVAVVTPDSILSAFIANTLVEELNRFNIETRTSRGKALREFLGRRVQESETDLATAESDLARFQNANLRIGNAPHLALEKARLERRVDIASDLYRLLTRQYEMARIEEQRDTPTFSTIDVARPPYRKFWPKTFLNAAIAALLALGLILGRYYLGQLFASHEVDARIEPVRSAHHGGQV